MNDDLKDLRDLIIRYGNLNAYLTLVDTTYETTDESDKTHRDILVVFGEIMRIIGKLEVMLNE